ncbi:hypothetical protein SDRG_12938 [Saprolegnia diclina VS20]|uniref:Uncharacterized protein n=1 Tax=Saprolegnia diclina (strain VS20) TaxID=1156394 RepID=T0Q716_SAPDV|nr:hypothetical protein SDRG_12938 [Saprolegnia diclina VS20]EQC29270.1 hypothetical protein SDRG_12938 [Saprolegnia diclina VS20]|eukprot:XP_008617244.1 hypothetical protein SDRG_12938 [Saprolegnia diclina VS20]
MDVAEQLAQERVKNMRLQEEVDRLRKAVVNVTLLAEKEEEWMINQFLRRVQPQAVHDTKQAKELEAEMQRLRHEKVVLGQRYEQEQESIVNRLSRQLQAKEATINALLSDDSNRWQDRPRDSTGQLQQILVSVLKEKRALEKQLADVLSRRTLDASRAPPLDDAQLSSLRQLLSQNQQASTAMLDQLSRMDQQDVPSLKRLRQSPLHGPLRSWSLSSPSPTSAC